MGWVTENIIIEDLRKNLDYRDFKNGRGENTKYTCQQLSDSYYRGIAQSLPKGSTEGLQRGSDDNSVYQESYFS